MKRLLVEFEDVRKEFDVECVNDNVYNWRVNIRGENGTPYANGIFILNIAFTDNYPFQAPKVVFLTKIYHMNVTDKGDVCLAILSKWMPINTVMEILKIIKSLLIFPNIENPLLPEIASLYITNKEEYDSNAKEWTVKYA